jgi:hypothetical protein
VNLPALGILSIGSCALLIAAFQHRHLSIHTDDEAPHDRAMPWNLYTEAGVIIMLTFAGLFFASQFLSQREHVIFCSALMAMLSILGSHNRLRVSLRDCKIVEQARRSILINHLFFCCAMGCFIGGLLLLIFDR